MKISSSTRIYDFLFLKKLLQDSDQMIIKDTKSRPYNASYTLKRVWPLLNRIGVSRVTDLTEFDYIGIPVISATRPEVSSAQITATQGKGIKKNEAIVSALMEAVERFSCANYKDIFTTRYNLSDSNYLMVNVGDISQWDGKIIEWVESTNLWDGSKKKLLASDVLFPYNPQEGVVRPVRPSTTGLASGNTLVEAILQGIFEVVERDATSKFIVNGVNARYIDLNSIETKLEKHLINLFKNANIDIDVYDLSFLAPISVFYVSILNSEGIGPDIACAGQGAHLFPEIALRRALTEAAQSRIVALQGSREDLVRHDSDWQGSYHYFKVNRELRKRKAIESRGVNLFEVTQFYTTRSIEDQIRESLDKLMKIGCKDVYYTNLTHEDTGIPVVHVCIPGMVDNVVDHTRTRVRNV